MVAALEAVTTPPRTKKSVRREAVDQVAGLLEEASLILEESEVPNIPMDDDPLDVGAAMPAREGPEEAEEEDPPIPDPLSESEPETTAPNPAEAPPEALSSQDPGIPEMDIFPSSEPLPEGTDPDLTLDFVTEGFEYLEQAEEALLTLEADPKDKEAVNVVFRAFHTIKGVSGFMELHRISDLAHHAETLLSKVRDDELKYTGVVADLSLRGIDVLKALLAAVREGVREGTLILTPDYGPLFTVLADPDLPAKIEAGKILGGLDAYDEMDDLEVDEEEEAVSGEIEQEGETPKRIRVTESSVRVRTDRLDRLVDMVGELVIAHSMLAQDPTILLDRGNLSRKVDHSAKILRELQDLSTSLRMVPLKPAFRKVARVVRDLSRKIGKPVDLITEGEDTEIDRTMVDVLADPLVHMVRNSLDHGLESPEDRAAAGKPKKGRVRISAFQAGGNVVIEVADDGRGLDREKILAKAIERGVVDSDRGMTDREIYNLIFAPGFSTAEQVTEVSGRGVGMDVVRRNVESLRGRVSIDSEPGRGSTFSIHLPLTLAITDGMVIRVGSQRYIIPSVKIQMSLRPDVESLSTVSGKGEMVLLQGDLLPIIRLHHLWGIPDAVEEPSEGLLVIVGEGSTRSALLVDELVTQQQFVVKPLSGVVANTQGVAGGAIMGNGDVGLILDPEGIIAKARGLSHAAAA
jgi:two-component system chemotaxis sensor kinase CheA